MDKKIVHIHRDTVEWYLKYGNQTATHRALNKFHAGKEEIPFDEEVPEKLRNATHQVHMNYHKAVTVTIYSDGTCDLKFD